MTHLPFENRVHAGQVLAEILAARSVGSDAAVLALTRGGVPVGAAIAERLHLPLDVVVVRKIGVPWNPELAMGAIAGSDLVLDRSLIDELDVSQPEVDAVIRRERARIASQADFFRGGLPALDVKGRPVILVDDGLATGSTMLAAIRHVRNLKPSKVIVAAPVGSDQACERIRAVADDLVCAAVPSMFVAVGQWYRDFQPTEDAEVRSLIVENRQAEATHGSPAVGAAGSV